MTPDDYPPRSLLYVPGSNARALEKAQGLAADLLSGATSVRIPMAPGFDSLNVATASGIVLHHLAAGR